MGYQTDIVGKRVVRTDSLAKVTGTALYTADMKLPNMLVAKILRSPHHHARIVKIDTSPALKVPGVKAAISGFDGYGIKWAFSAILRTMLCFRPIKSDISVRMLRQSLQ